MAARNAAGKVWRNAASVSNPAEPRVGQRTARHESGAVVTRWSPRDTRDMFHIEATSHHANAWDHTAYGKICRHAAIGGEAV